MSYLEVFFNISDEKVKCTMCQSQTLILSIFPFVFKASFFFWSVPKNKTRSAGRKGKMGAAPQTLDAIGLGAPAVQRRRRRANTIGWLVSGQDASSRCAHFLTGNTRPHRKGNGGERGHRPRAASWFRSSPWYRWD